MCILKPAAMQRALCGIDGIGQVQHNTWHALINVNQPGNFL